MAAPVGTTRCAQSLDAKSLTNSNAVTAVEHILIYSKTERPLTKPENVAMMGTMNDLSYIWMTRR